jgi:mannose/fructose/N-acetylgalactosamine-specific phosphotransferase system component IID
MGWGAILFNHIDLLWVPVALCLHKGQWVKAILFVLMCAFVMRLQIELMQSIGYGKGFFHLMEASLYIRGLVTYSVFILGFFVLSSFSPRTDSFVYIAASITIFITAFCVSSLVMVL